MIKTVIIDDEPLARSIVKEYLQAHSQFEIMEECGDGFSGAKAIQAHQPNLIFLDIQMPKISGFEMLEILDNVPSTIFTTAFEEYAIKAFEAQAIDYLLKPFSKERFDKAIEKWMANYKNNTPTNSVSFNEFGSKQPDEHQRIVVKNGSNIQIIPTHDVYYIEAYDDYVKIYTAAGMQLKKKTLTYYENTLDSKVFLRVHRSFIIQLNQLTKVEPYDKHNHIALLKNGAKVPLSRAGYVRLKEMLGI
jgi:two-component system LytT family response regulator